MAAFLIHSVDGGGDEDFKDITIRINGGLNGLAERRKYYDVAKKALGVGGQELDLTSTRVTQVDNSA